MKKEKINKYKNYFKNQTSILNYKYLNKFQIL